MGQNQMPRLVHFENKKSCYIPSTKSFHKKCQPSLTTLKKDEPKENPHKKNEIHCRDRQLGEGIIKNYTTEGSSEDL